MIFDVTFDEQNTDFDVNFKDGGVNIRDTIVDKEVSLKSDNPVQNKVITQYVDDSITKVLKTLEESIDNITDKDDVNITDIKINDNKELVVSYSDDTTVNLGTIVGLDGQDGQDGKDGIGIQSIEQTVFSTEDSGDNIFTITLTDGNTTTFTVKNGSKGSGSDAQSDWNQTDENADDYIKNKPFYYGETYVEDLVFPTPNELYVTTAVASDGDQGFALLGQKAPFVAGQTYTYELKLNIEGEVVHTDTTTLKAYSLTALGFPATFADAIALIDSNENPYIISGAILTDLKNFSDIAPADDTMFFTYKSHQEDMSVSITCKGYNNTIWQYNTIDVNYLPMEQIGENIKLPNAYIRTAMLTDSVVTTDKLADGSVTPNKIANNAIGNDSLQDGAITTEKLADGSITTEKLADGSITEDKIKDSSITAQKIRNGAVTGEKLSGTIPYNLLTPMTIGEEQVATEDVAYINTDVGTTYWETLLVYGTIYPTSNDEQYLCIGYRSGSPITIIQVPINATNIEKFRVTCLIKAYNYNQCLIHVILSSTNVNGDQEIYAEKTSGLTFIDDRYRKYISIYLKGGASEMVGSGSSLNYIIDTVKRR